MSMENKTRWLDDLLEEENMTSADLARAANLDSAVISNIRNGRREIGIETAISIAKATHRKPETILRMAGKFPTIDSDPWVDEMAHKLSLLPRSLRNVVARFISSMLEGDGPDQGKTRSKPKSPKL